MSKFQYFLVLVMFLSNLTTGQAQNLTIYRSHSPVDVTTFKMESVIKSLELILFETVSHDSIAKQRGVLIPATKSVLFEDSELITKLIQCQQTTALDLPLEILIWEENGDAYIGFIDPKFMKKRFLIVGCDETIDELSRLMIRICTDTLRD